MQQRAREKLNPCNHPVYHERRLSFPAGSRFSKPPKDEPTPKPTGTYKPPAMRNASASTPSSGMGKRHLKNAPQITSELHFPSLSSAVDSRYMQSESDRSFLSVKHGVRSKGDQQKELQLDLENKFSALQ
ncbi:uncharacterized protein TNCV_2630381 [Trichonephila clavipes]|uniref:Uncharacterized protein n=1 Tax=Trichonephila clavipes TaxID=2585209 RepID=A0A8X6SBZ7_TRICX|nr:uncharacterized protein TNCV_2630381 [Trichonephila clavipes]